MGGRVREGVRAGVWECLCRKGACVWEGACGRAFGRVCVGGCAWKGVWEGVWRSLCRKGVCGRVFVGGHVW